MTAGLGRVRGVFVRPAGGAASAVPLERTSARTAPMRVAVVCPPAEAMLAGASVALAAAQCAGARAAVVCAWSGADARAADRGAGGFALVGASRLAERLRRREIPARARGRLVGVPLPAEAAQARAVAERVSAAGAEVPVVVVVAGSRSELFDPLLAAQDRVVVVPPAGELAAVGELAALEVARCARAVGVLALAGSGAGLGRLAAQAGLALPAATRRAAIAALRGHGG
ncbi:MAG TPA: hypothetical protein VFT50_02495 [Baekduia sp.]|nr:hypothetical protein [Baekduia sp.]